MKNDAVNGRPRDPGKDDAVRKAVRKLLTKGGYHAATIPAVAREAKVGPPTIYRRWSTQSAMVESALGAGLHPQGIDDFDDFDSYLRAFVASVVSYFADPANRAAVPGLLVEYYRDPRRYKALVTRAEDPIRELFAEAHASAVRTGDIAADPRADALFDTVIGMAIYHGVWRRAADKRLVDEILAVVRAAIRPAGAKRRRTPSEH